MGGRFKGENEMLKDDLEKGARAVEKNKRSMILALGLTLVSNPKKKAFVFKRKFLEDLWNEIYQTTRKDIKDIMKTIT